MGRACVAVLIGGMALVSSAAAAGPVPPVDVSAASSTSPGSCGLFGFHPGIGGVDVASNARGDTIVSWTRNDGAGAYTAQASFRPAGGSFGPPQDIGPTQTCYFIFGLSGPTPDVAIDENGGAVIVYGAPVGGTIVARAAIKPPGGAFGASVDLSDGSQSASVPRVAMNAAGMAVAVWSWGASGSTVVQTATRQPGQAFGGADDLTAPAADANSPRVAVNDAGATAAAWVGSNGTVDLAQARVRPAGANVFGPVQDLSDTGVAGQDATVPDVAIDPAGRTTVVWIRNDGTQRRLESRILSPEGVRGLGIEHISEAGEHASNPNLALDPANTAVAVFGACPTGGGSCAVKAAARASGSGWGAVQAISGAGDDSSSPRVVMDAGGVATAAFSPSGSLGPVVMTRRPAGGSFGAVQPISPSGGSGFAPAVAVDDQGNVLAGWSFRSDAAGNPYTAQATAYDAAPPTLAAVSVPSAGAAGQPVGMAAAATDRWSHVALHWNFGDGGTASGGAVTHAFGAGGAFNVTVTATDAVGNASSATRPIVISPAPAPPKQRITSPVKATWALRGNQLAIVKLVVRRAPKGASAQLRCKGKKCPVKRKTFKKRRNGSITLFKEVKPAKALSQKQRRFRPGQLVDVRVTKAGFIGKVVRYRIKKGKIPSGQNLCLPVGAKTPRSRC